MPYNEQFIPGHTIPFPSLAELAAMIAEAAYFIAERRNLQPGDELSDWLTAEQIVDSILGSTRPAPASSAAKGAARKPAKKKAKKKVTAKKTNKKTAKKK